jgi:hypothetical protein
MVLMSRLLLLLLFNSVECEDFTRCRCPYGELFPDAGRSVDTSAPKLKVWFNSCMRIPSFYRSLQTTTAS